MRTFIFSVTICFFLCFNVFLGQSIKKTEQRINELEQKINKLENTMMSLMEKIVNLENKLDKSSNSSSVQSIKGNQSSKTTKIKKDSVADQNDGRCKANTKKGTRCSRAARSNGYCWQHGG